MDVGDRKQKPLFYRSKDFAQRRYGPQSHSASKGKREVCSEKDLAQQRGPGS
ncbi:Hypothetical predicted protein, partial [Marmota monax]